MGSEETGDDSSHVAAIARGVAASAASDVETAQTASEEESRPGAEAKEDGGFSTFSASDSVPLASLKALPDEEDENIRPGAFAVDGIDGVASSDGFTWNPNPPRVQSDRTVVQVDAVLVTDEPPQAMHDDVPYVDAAPIDTPWTLNFKSRGVQLLVYISLADATHLFLSLFRPITAIIFHPPVAIRSPWLLNSQEAPPTSQPTEILKGIRIAVRRGGGIPQDHQGASRSHCKEGERQSLPPDPAVRPCHRNENEVEAHPKDGMGEEAERVCQGPSQEGQARFVRQKEQPEQDPARRQDPPSGREGDCIPQQGV